MSEIPMEIEDSAVSIFKPTEDISPIILQSNVQLNGTAPSETVSPQLFEDNSSKLISEPTESSINTDDMGLPENEDPPTETLPSKDSSADKSSIPEPQATTQISYCNGAIEPVSTVGNIITEADKEDSNLDNNLIDNNNDQNSMDVPPSDDNDDGVKNCYCGKRRNLNLVELQCAGCYKWFHDTCITFDIGKCVPFMTYYTFFCKTCSPSGSETFFKKQPNFSQMCATAIANLTQQSSMDGELKTMFSKDKDVIPYIESNWEYLTSMPRRVKQTWHLTVYKAMLKDNDLFVCDERRDESFPMEQPTFGLANQDLYKIGPCYESSMRSMQKQAQEVSQPDKLFHQRLTSGLFVNLYYWTCCSFSLVFVLMLSFCGTILTEEEEILEDLSVEEVHVCTGHDLLRVFSRVCSIFKRGSDIEEEQPSYPISIRLEDVAKTCCEVPCRMSIFALLCS